MYNIDSNNNNNNNGNISFSIQLKLQLQISLLQGNLQLASLVLQEKNYNNRKVKEKTEKNKTTKIKTDVIPDLSMVYFCNKICST